MREFTLTTLSGSFRYTRLIFLEPTRTRTQFPRKLSKRICSRMLRTGQLEVPGTSEYADKSVFSRLSMLLYVSTWMSDIRSAARSRWSRLVTGSGFGSSLLVDVEEDAAGVLEARMDFSMMCDESVEPALTRSFRSRSGESLVILCQHGSQSRAGQLQIYLTPNEL